MTTDGGLGRDRDQAASEPVIRVVRGDPEPAELAALLAVLTAVGAPDSGADRAQSVGSWSVYWRGVRQPLHPGALGSGALGSGGLQPGADGWRGSARPR